MVSGRRNRSKLSSRSNRVIRKVPHNDHGRVCWQGTGMNRARTSFQNLLCANVTNHQVRHRSNVRRSIPNLSRRTSTRAGLIPCCIADISTTAIPQ